jgi:hypothetical protein
VRSHFLQRRRRQRMAARGPRGGRRDQSVAGRLTHVSACSKSQGKVAQLDVGSNATRSRSGKLNREELLRRRRYPLCTISRRWNDRGRGNRQGSHRPKGAGRRMRNNCSKAGYL